MLAKTHGSETMAACLLRQTGTGTEVGQADHCATPVPPERIEGGLPKASEAP